MNPGHLIGRPTTLPCSDVFFTTQDPLFFCMYCFCCLDVLSDGDSGDSSSDSDGGPGFFDGINDNPSEEAFLAASAGRKQGGRLSPSSGAGVDKHAGDDGSDWDGDRGANIAPLVEKRTGDENGGHIDSAEPATTGGKSVERKETSVGSKARSSSNSSTIPCMSENAGETGVLAEVPDGTAKRKKSEEQDEDKESGKGAPPANFSKVDPSLRRAALARRFPLFLEAESRTVEVEAGQMLYLPAGWFHEVSCNSPLGLPVPMVFVGGGSAGACVHEGYLADGSS